MERPESRPIVNRAQRVSVVVLGDRGSGSSSLISRFRTRSFVGPQRTDSTGHIESFSHELDVPGQRCSLDIWDCGCLPKETESKQMQTIAQRLVKNANVVLVTYESPTQETIATVQWAANLLASLKSKAQIIGVRTKADLAYTGLTYENAAAFIRTNTQASFATSALTGDGVDMLFQSAVGMAVLSRAWHPSRVGAQQRLAWAKVVTSGSHLFGGAAVSVLTKVGAWVAGLIGVAASSCPARLWPVIGRASFDDGVRALEAKSWTSAHCSFGVTAAVFKPFPALLKSMEDALLCTMQFSIRVSIICFDAARSTI